MCVYAHVIVPIRVSLACYLQLDFVLSAKAASQEVADAMAQHAQERMEVRTVPVVVDKQPSTFTIRFDEIMKVCRGVGVYMWVHVCLCKNHPVAI